MEKYYVVAAFNCGWVPLVLCLTTSKRKALEWLKKTSPGMAVRDVQAVGPSDYHYAEWFQKAKANTIRIYGSEAIRA